MSASLKHDYIRATPKWRKLGARYDAVIINGFEGYEFAHVYAIFAVGIHPVTYHIALVRRYKNAGHHTSSDYIQLQDVDDIDCIFVDSII